jgi:hypothetical protein
MKVFHLKRANVLWCALGGLFFLIATTLSSGCAKGVPDRDVLFTIATSRALTHGTVKVFVGENELGLIQFEDQQPLKAVRGINLSDFRTQVLCPDGWRNCDVTAQAIGKSIYLELVLPPTTAFYVDLDDRESVELVIGEIQLKLNKSHPKKVLIAAAEKPIGVKIEGKEVQVVDAGRAYLVDPTGEHTYSVRTVTYRSGKYGLAFGPRDPDPWVLRQRIMQELTNPPDYFLEHAPTQLKGETGFQVTKTELTRVK